MRRVPTLPAPIRAISVESGSLAGITPEKDRGATAPACGTIARETSRVVAMTRRRMALMDLGGSVSLRDDLAVGCLGPGVALNRPGFRVAVLTDVPASQDHSDCRRDYGGDHQQHNRVEQQASRGVAAPRSIRAG